MIRRKVMVMNHVRELEKVGNVSVHIVSSTRKVNQANEDGNQERIESTSGAEARD